MFNELNSDKHNHTDSSTFPSTFNQPLSKQYYSVLLYWQQSETVTIEFPQEIINLILTYSQYASDFYVNNNLHSSVLDIDIIPVFNDFGATFRCKDPFPLKKGKYTFAVTFKSTTTMNPAKGENLTGLNFVGVCSEQYAEFNDYLLYSDKKHIYGFGDDMSFRGWVTWRYFGNGDPPTAWFEIDRSIGGFGHDDELSIEVNMDECWLRAYKNGKRFIENDSGDIDLQFLKENKSLQYYPVVSFTDLTDIECCISFHY